MKTLNKAILLLGGLAAIWTPISAIAQEGIPVGVVLEIKGPVYLKTAPTSVPLQLDAKRDVMRRLYADQSLQAGPGGSIKLGLSTGIREIGPPEGWFVLRRAASLTAEQTKVAQALRRYGTPGGTRGMTSTVFSPADGSTVRPTQLVIRWHPSTQSSTIDLRVETESGQVLWSQVGVDATSGRHDSVAARRALIEYQAGGGQEDLTLVRREADGTESRVYFSLLTKTSERELEAELSKWNQAADPLLRAIGRAYEFGRRRLLVEAAEEFEAALALAPDSQDLILSTIDAHRRTGNYARAADLKNKLRDPPDRIRTPGTG